MLPSQEFSPPALTAAREEDTPTLQGDSHSTKTVPACEEVVSGSIEAVPVCRNSVQATSTLNVSVGDAIHNAIAGDDVGMSGSGSSGDGKPVLGEEEFPFVPSTPVSPCVLDICL